MKRKKSFDWYGARQRFSIRTYHFGAASVLLGLTLATGAQAVQAEELVADTTVTSSIQSPATTDTTPALTTETVTPAERTATINYVVNYVLEDGTLVNAGVKTATVTTTEAVASTSVEVAVEVPAGYELAQGQATTVTQVVTEGAENLVTVQLVKKAEVAAPTTEAPATTTEAATETPADATEVAAPVTAEEAKVVLEQNISEAVVLSDEANRLYAAAPEGNESLKAAADATKLTATEATTVLKDSVATLVQVNAQIDAVRTNVEALALELRKFLGTDLIQVALTTTTTMDNGTGMPGTWKEDQTVNNKDEAAASATLTPSSQDFPAGYVGDPNTNRTTFMIYSLSGLQDSGITPGTLAGSFNLRRGTDLYMVLSVNRLSDDGDFIYLNLYDKKTGQIALDDNGNKIQEELAVGVGEVKELTGLNAYAKQSSLTQNFKYTLSLTETEFKNAAGESSVLRNMQLKSNMGDTALNTLVYSNLTTSRGDYNDYSGAAPTYTPRQVTSYFVKATDLRDQEFLASYTQDGDLSGDHFTIAGEGIFDNYELIESPAITSGTLASDYVAGTALIRWYAGSLQSKVQYITKDDGSARYLQFLANPDHPDFLETYAKYKTMAETDFQAEAETAFRLAERIAIVEKVEKDIAAVNADTTLSDSEKTAKIQTIRTEATAKINTADDKFFLTYSGENLDPLDYNDSADVVTGLDEWNYTSTKYKFSANNVTSDTLSSKVGEYQGYPKAIWNNVNTGILTILDQDGKPVVNPYTNTTMTFKGHQLSMFNSNGANFNNQVYYYAEKGGVKVYYVDTEGNVLQDSKSIYDHEATNTAYDTKSVKDETITAADGTVYYYKEIDTTGLNPASSNTDTEKRTIEKITEEVGTVAQDTLKEMTYVYEKAGSVIVNYITEDGTPLSGTTNTGATTASTVDDTKDGKPGSTYDTTDLKPTTITTADGKTYELVPASTVGDETGTVEAGVTKEVTYVYKEVKGDVIVHYVDQDGNPISGTTDAGTTTASTVTDTPESSTGTPYDTTDLKPNTITTADGKVYRLVPAATQGNEKGDVVVGTTEITYVYELVEGDVIVHYVDTEGNTIASDVTDTPTSDTGIDYDTTDNKPEKIVNDETGDVYYYKEVKAGDNETGKVVEGTTEVTYIYEKAGSVNVNYVDTDGNPLIAPVADVTDGKPGSDYDTLVDNKPETIATADGKLYRLVPAGTYNVGTVSDDNNLTAAGNGTATGVDSVTGTVEAGTTKEITYVYEEVKGDVVVEYYDTDGNVIATTVVDTPTSSTGTPYNTLDQKPATITAADGTVYYYKEVKSTSAAEDGTVVEGTTTVQYVYEKAGSVNVNYVDTDGNPIQAPVADETNEKAGTEYSTTDNKPSTITTEDGKTYRLVEKEKAGDFPVGTVSESGNLTAAGNGTATGVDSETGTVVAGTTKEITYVYEEVKGSVVVNYITTDGTVIKQPVEDTPTSSTGTPYDTTDNKPATITTEDGKTYRLVPSLTKGNETGDVVEGTTEVTYVYEEVKGDVVVEYYDTEGNLISGLSDSGEAVDTKEVDTPSTSTGTAYNTDEDHKPNTITTADGTVYYYKEVKDTSASTTGEVVEGTTTVQYVYEKAGNVIVHYITEDGTVIKATVTDEENAEPGKSYTTTDNKPTTITTEDGTVYELIPTATIGNEDGSVEAGKTIEVTYVYRKVETPTPDVKTGSVVIRYVEAGNESNVLKDPVLDENAVVTGTKYDTTDEGDKPAEIVKDGVRYVLVPSKTTAVDPNGNPVTETGEVAEGTTVVTYKYQKVANWIPQIPATPENPTPVNPVIPYPFDPTNPDKPIDPTTPYPGGEVPSIPHVPGFTPVDPKTNEPLKPVDPTDPSKGYVPPTPDESGIDTPIPYVQNGNVVVNYVTEDGTPIKKPVQDETDAPAGKSYDTTDNKPTEIIGEDGSRYVLIPSKTIGSETGTVEGGKTTEITYVYKKVANWIPEIPATPENPTPVNPVIPYPFDPTNPDKPIDPTSPYPDGEVPSIPHVPGFTPVDPKTNEPLKPVDPNDPGKGYVPPTPDESGKDTPIPYVQNGNVVVNYVTEDGTPIKTPVNDETNAPAGKSYDTTDNKPTEIIGEDGSRYVLIPSKTIGSETGTVEGGKTTEITYVYKKVANWIPQIPGVPEGQEPKVPYPFDPTNPDKPIDPTSPYPDGEVPSIPHVPGFTPVDPKDNTPLTPVDPEDPSKGYVPPTPDESGKDTPIPYVQNGNVVVNYVTEDGTPIKTPVNDETNAPAGKSYDTTDNKPTEIIGEDGSRYVLIPSKTVGSETGSVEGGKTTEITYVYKKVANWIPQIPATPENPTPVNPVIPYPFDPTNPDKPIDPTTPYPDGEVPSIPHVPGFTPVDPKTNEPLKPVDPTDPSKGYVPPTPDESGIDTPIPYVQNGNVVVNYVDENGNVIKTPVNDETDAPAGKSYDTTDNKPNTITTEDGTTYELVRVDGSETGTVVGGKTTEVTYVYRKVETPAKKVVTNHVDENGNPIAPQEDGTTPNKSIPGYEFTGKTVTDPDGNTTHIYRKVETPAKKVVTNHVDENGNPIAPQEDGTTPNKSIPGYEFTGKTVTDPDGNTTHIYRKVSNPVTPKPGTPTSPAPQAPATPKPQAPVAPTTDKAGAAQLPNTGEASSAAAILGAGMLVAALALAGKRRRNED
ncbi:MucBP domain-containing protein [Streptococcus suis]